MGLGAVGNVVSLRSAGGVWHRGAVAAPVVEVAREADGELVEAMARLVPQLSSSSPAPTEAQLAEIVASPSSRLLVARIDGRIVGSLTLVMFRIPTGLRAWIEDVVVDASARGAGVGEALNRFALDEARRAGATTVDLTSRPSREAANRLYRRLGFVQRETNVYRYEL
jgi:ribosomal protein S18 acetylase RimI-like enzyme